MNQSDCRIVRPMPGLFSLLSFRVKRRERRSPGNEVVLPAVISQSRPQSLFPLPSASIPGLLLYSTLKSERKADKISWGRGCLPLPLSDTEKKPGYEVGHTFLNVFILIGGIYYCLFLYFNAMFW